MNTGIGLIESERMRQIFAKGYTADHDDKHDWGEMARAAASYAIQANRQLNGAESSEGTPPLFPWPDEDWKPSLDPVRNLVKAGALIAAEIDRLLRAENGAALPGKVK